MSATLKLDPGAHVLMQSQYSVGTELYSILFSSCISMLPLLILQQCQSVDPHSVDTTT